MEADDTSVTEGLDDQGFTVHGLQDEGFNLVDDPSNINETVVRNIVRLSLCSDALLDTQISWDTEVKYET